MSIFRDTGSVKITGGTFPVVMGEANTNPGMEKLSSHISPAALHNSQEQRKSKDFHKTVKDIADEWSSHPQNISTNIGSYPRTISDRSVVYDALRDVLQWFYDPFTPFLMKWMHSERSQTTLLAHVLADMLYERKSLSSTFFSSPSGEATNSASILPTIVHQLAQNIPLAKDHIAHAVANDPNIFTLTISQQVKKLVVEPLTKASKMCTESTIAPRLILIHGLEDCNCDVDFLESFLESFSRALISIQDLACSHKLLILGLYTDQLEECFSNVAYQPTPQQSSLLLQNGFPNVQVSPPVLVHPSLFLQKSSSHFPERPVALRRPLLVHAWLGRGQDLCRREREVEQKEEELERIFTTFIKDRWPQAYHRLGQMRLEVTQREEVVRLLEKEVELNAMNLDGERQQFDRKVQELEERERTVKANELRHEREREEMSEKEERIKQRELVVEKKEEDFKRDITFAPPLNPVGLVTLADLTYKALQGLEPLYNPSSPWYKGGIPVHVKKIVSAIDSCIVASKRGQSIASEIVNFVLAYVDISSLNETNQDSGRNNLRNSLQTIVTLADEGHALSSNALNEFRGVRRRLEKVGLNHLPHLISLEKGNNFANIFKNFGQHWWIANDAVDRLEELGGTLAVYVIWWADLKAKAHEAQRNNINLYPLHHERVLAEWRAIQDDYATYGQKIIGIENSYRHMLNSQPSQGNNQ